MGIARKTTIYENFRSNTCYVFEGNDSAATVLFTLETYEYGVGPEWQETEIEAVYGEQGYIRLVSGVQSVQPPEPDEQDNCLNLQVCV